MKIIKKAFSLIEVLLVMGIVAVVTAMGFSISQKGMENAYNLYWYTGYIALHDAIYDAVQRGIFNTDSPNLTTLVNHISTLVKGSSSGNIITAPNDIVFQFEDIKGTNYNSAGIRTLYYKITMTVPAPKTFPDRTVFIYNLNSNSDARGLLYPANYTANSYLNLHERVDLLPFAIKRDGTRSFTVFYNFKEAYCRANGNVSITNIDNNANIDCSSIPVDSNGRGTLVPINPKKAF